MCGIFGVVATRNVYDDLVRGIKRLEYRGYDSVGFAVHNCTDIIVRKSTGKVEEVIQRLKVQDLRGTTGVAHSRWATTGQVNDVNAHPHRSGEVVVVHNGIIENYVALKTRLLRKGFHFVSETDTEVVAHYFADLLEHMDVHAAYQRFIEEVEGTFAILLMKQGEEKIYAMRKDSPLVVGICKNKTILASDIYAFSDQTNKAIFLKDYEYVVVDKAGFTVYDKTGESVVKNIIEFTWDTKPMSKKSFNHYMLKEIHEEEEAAARLLQSIESVQKDRFMHAVSLISKAKRVVFLAAGSSYHASMIGASLLNSIGKESFAVVASDYEECLVTKDTLLIAVTQSGETMDIIKAVKSLQKEYLALLSLVNVPHSSIERMGDERLEICAGQEICVAATKSFMNQVLLLMKLTEAVGGCHFSMTPKKLRDIIAETKEKLVTTASALASQKSLYVLGRGPHYAMAKEIALKIKEITYIHAEGLHAGELKHGPLALIEKGVPVISLVHDDNAQVISNTKEVEAREAYVVVITDGSYTGDVTFTVPKGDKYSFALYAAVVGQLIAYYTALELKLPIDKPRNLAKSVTVS